MTDEEIEIAAWSELLAGARSHLEDWMDEEGEFGQEADSVRRKQWDLLKVLEDENL